MKDALAEWVTTSKLICELVWYVGQSCLDQIETRILFCFNDCSMSQFEGIADVEQLSEEEKVKQGQQTSGQT